MEEKKVSIIIPVYNSEKYLQECIDSFLKQTYKNIELVVIDDGSTDNSLKILKDYQKCYEDKIVLYSQKNQGVAVTRNKGVIYSNGVYIMFSDNDDYVEVDYVETMVRQIEMSQVDMVICSCRKVDEFHNILYEQVLTQDEWAKFRIIAPWARIIRKDFIIEKNVKFGNFKLGEDSFFSITAYNETNKIKVISYIGYNWVERRTSVSNTIQKRGVVSPLPFLDALIKRNDSCKYIKESYFWYFIIKFIVWNLYYVCDDLSLCQIKEYCIKYFKWLEEVNPYFKKNELVSIKNPKGEKVSIRLLVFLFVKFHTVERILCLVVVKYFKKINSLLFRK